MTANDYHIDVFYSPEDEAWIANVPDLEHCSAHGPTRRRQCKRSWWRWNSGWNLLKSMAIPSRNRVNAPQPQRVSFQWVRRSDRLGIRYRPGVLGCQGGLFGRCELTESSFAAYGVGAVLIAVSLVAKSVIAGIAIALSALLIYWWPRIRSILK